MKTASQNREEIRENSITVPMSEFEKERIRAAARDMGVPMSAFVRIVLKNYLKEAGF